MKKIGIIGSGAVARALSKGFADKRCEVMIGTRTLAKMEDWCAENKLRCGSFEEAARFGEILVLCVKGSAAEDVLQSTGDAINGKIVIDTTNPIANEPPTDGVIHFFTGPNDSLAERLQNNFPAARFVKAFNSVGSAMMYQPRLEEGGKASMFICGNDESAKSAVAEIVESFGWQACDMGRITSARAIEPLCQLWCIPGFLHSEWSHAFKMVKGAELVGSD